MVAGKASRSKPKMRRVGCASHFREAPIRVQYALVGRRGRGEIVGWEKGQGQYAVVGRRGRGITEKGQGRNRGRGGPFA